MNGRAQTGVRAGALVVSALGGVVCAIPVRWLLGPVAGSAFGPLVVLGWLMLCTLGAAYASRIARCWRVPERPEAGFWVWGIAFALWGVAAVLLGFLPKKGLPVQIPVWSAQVVVGVVVAAVLYWGTMPAVGEARETRQLAAARAELLRVQGGVTGARASGNVQSVLAELDAALADLLESVRAKPGFGGWLESWVADHRASRAERKFTGIQRLIQAARAAHDEWARATVSGLEQEIAYRELLVKLERLNEELAELRPETADEAETARQTLEQRYAATAALNETMVAGERVLHRQWEQLRREISEGFQDARVRDEFIRLVDAVYSKDQPVSGQKERCERPSSPPPSA